MNELQNRYQYNVQIRKIDMNKKANKILNTKSIQKKNHITNRHCEKDLFSIRGHLKQLHV